MKKLILLGALSVLFYSAPGYAAGSEADADKEIKKELGGKVAAEKDEREERAARAVTEGSGGLVIDKEFFQAPRTVQEVPSAARRTARIPIPTPPAPRVALNYDELANRPWYKRGADSFLSFFLGGI